MIKDKNKEVYTSPITEALELQVERCIMDVSNGVNYPDTPGWAGGNDTISNGGSF